MCSFIAIDYETANSSYESACSIGATVVIDGEITSNLYSLIKPPKDFFSFDSFNVSIHGITEKDVENAPSFDVVWNDIERLLESKDLPLACHYAGFDIRVTESLLRYFKRDFQEIRFYDTCTVSRNIWPELLNFKLNTISSHLGIDLEHHNAASDALSCAMIALKHIEILSLSSLSEIARSFGYDLGILSSTGIKNMSGFRRYGNYARYSKESGSNSSRNVLPNQDVNAESDFFGKNLVFTGTLVSMGRKEAIQRAVNNGASVLSAVSKKTNFLVVGISDFIDFEKGKMTNKLRDAELFKQRGYEISIIDEEEFLKMSI